MTTNGLLYKYRSLDNWKFIVDIIVNERLYAAPFMSLNDPMEGRYFYFGDNVAKGFKKALYESKLRRNICSLSKDKKSTLLWSYYAGGHTGVAFGVAVSNRPKTLEVRDVRYDNGIHIGPKEVLKNADTVALDILTQKQLPWRHEQEVRVFAPTNFVPIKLKEVVLGLNFPPADKELIKALARRWHPRVKITQIKQSFLDRPDAV